MNTKLRNHLLIDVCCVWPLLLSCLLAATSSAVQAVAYAITVAIVCCFVVAAGYPIQMWDAAKEMAEERTGTHFIYVVSSSAAEIGIFLYTGFWGLAWVWAILLAFEIAAQIKLSRKGE